MYEKKVHLGSARVKELNKEVAITTTLLRSDVHPEEKNKLYEELCKTNKIAQIAPHIAAFRN